MNTKESMKDKYRERLKKIIGKKIQTTMIFPLSQFEAAFGELWGDKLPDESLTDQQRSMRAKWKQCRDNILNMGNAQIRNAETELSQHDVVWKKYNILLLPVNGN